MSSHPRSEQLLAEMEAILAEEPALREIDRASIIRELREELEAIAAAPQTLDAEALRRTWLQLAEDFGQGASASIREQVVRQVDAMLQPLQAANSQDFVAYQRMCLSDGEAAAQQWLNQRNIKRREKQQTPPHTMLNYMNL
jgi:hypothetical protein